jgi:hypothetical protein
MDPRLLRWLAPLLGAYLIGCGSSSDNSATDNGTDTTTTGGGDNSGAAGSNGSGGASAGTGGASTSGGTGGARPGSGGSTGTGGATGGAGSSGTSLWVKDGKPGSYANCADATVAAAKPDEDTLLVSLWQQGIWASKDGGATFTKLGTGAGSSDVKHGPVAMLFDPKDPKTFWESGMYGPGAYKSADDGTTIKLLGTIQHLDGMSVDFSDPDRKTLLAGGHEQKQTVYRSSDGGATWANIGASIAATVTACTYPLVIDAQTYLLGCSGDGWIMGDQGVYRSADAGATWARTNMAAAGPDPLVASDGTIYWTILYNRGMLVSSDQGKTWTQPIGYGSIVPATATELPDGRVAAAAVKGKQLMITADKGKTFKPIGSPLPYDPAGVTYSKFRKAFYIWHGDCKDQTAKDAIMHLPFDWNTPDGSPSGGAPSDAGASGAGD